MKKILMILFTALTFTGCNYTDAPPNTFIVKKVIPKDDMKQMCIYKIKMLDASGVQGMSFFYTDSLNKYKVGDELHLTPAKD
jgi:PBP1b-binding outer membrane lipoprotein LpoB